MQTRSRMAAWRRLLLLAVACLVTGDRAMSAPPAPASSPGAGPARQKAADTARRELLAKYAQTGSGASREGSSDEAARIDQGVAQVLRLWRDTDGTPEEMAEFLRSEFLPRGETLDATFDRFQMAFERIGGYLTSMERDLRRQVDLDIGPILSLDQRLAAYSPRAHVQDDLFDNKIAFVALLNFPLTTLADRMSQGPTWTRRQWSEARLVQGFSARVPAQVSQRISKAFADADAYISTYNIHMHNLIGPNGTRPFPEGLRLITHWGLRDELKAHYADRGPEGLVKQRMIQQVMDRIVRQEIPSAAIDSPTLVWDPAASASETLREADERYRHWLEIFRAEREADPFYPDNPTFVDRRFNIDREIPEAQVRQLLEAVLESPLGAQVGQIISRRLGRPLEPFDIWYAGFKPRGKHTEEELDALTRARYPTPAAYAADIPRLLKDLGFSADQASFLSAHIEVDPSRGAGHAMGASRRDDKAHLRTRVGPGGMDYKGYNIAVHEMGHNVEQVFSVTGIDHTLLQGVPNNAFTEALAFVFQSRDLELLGLGGPDPEAESLKALEEFWATREIAGVALVDMQAWRWLYGHPDATPAEFRRAVVGIAKEIWNRHYAPLFHVNDVTLLAVYSHMIDNGMYTPDYPLGHLIAFQIEEHFGRSKPIGPEFERICKLGSVTPDAWMRQGVGSPLSAEPLLRAAGRAVGAIK